MISKLTAILAALALAVTSLAPSAAEARDHHRGWDRGGYYHGGGRHWRGHDDDGDELAAGAIGLVLGLALGAAASQPRQARYGYSSGYNCYRCAPPPPPCGGGCYNQGYYDQHYSGPPPGYYNQGYDDRDLEGGYEPYYDQRSSCTRRERQWDRYANRYVIVDVPC